MADLPALDQYDYLAALVSACLIVVGYVVHPTHLTQVAVWVTIFTIMFCWIGYFLWKWVYDMEM